MMGAASSMATILNDVLDLGQLQQGKLALEPAATALTETLLRSASAIQGISPVPIFVHTGASMPDMVVIDRLRYGQVCSGYCSYSTADVRLGSCYPWPFAVSSDFDECYQQRGESDKRWAYRRCCPCGRWLLGHRGFRHRPWVASRGARFVPTVRPSHCNGHCPCNAVALSARYWPWTCYCRTARGPYAWHNQPCESN